MRTPTLGAARKVVTLEALLTHPDAFALTGATPVQRAVCRVLDGLPLAELALDPDVQWAFGGELALKKLPVGRMPDELFFIAAVRGAKTLISACVAFRSAITCDLSPTRPDEPVRASIVSLDLDKAQMAIEHLTGALSNGKLLRPFFVHAKGFEVIVRHPSGRHIEIKCLAGKRAGGELVSRWSAGATFDEFPRMQGQQDGKIVNFEESRKAVVARMLPGAQLLGIGSPWAPRGPAYDAVQNEWGKPTPARVVVRGRGPMLNPVWWTPEQIAKVRAMQDGELIVQTDCEAEFGDLESQFFTAAMVERVLRSSADHIPREKGWSYAAFQDPAATGNAWTLVIVGKKAGKTEADAIYVVVAHAQWQGSKQAPLKNKAVFAEIKPLLKHYGLSSLTTDRWSAHSIAEHGEEVGVHVDIDDATEPEKAKRYLDLMALVVAEQPRISLPKEEAMRLDLLGIKKQLTTTGMRFELPFTGNGRHCDFAPSLVGAIDKARQSASWTTAADDWGQLQKARADEAANRKTIGKPAYCKTCQQFFVTGCDKHPVDHAAE